MCVHVCALTWACSCRGEMSMSDLFPIVLHLNFLGGQCKVFHWKWKFTELAASNPAPHVLPSPPASLLHMCWQFELSPSWCPLSPNHLFVSLSQSLCAKCGSAMPPGKKSGAQHCLNVCEQTVPSSFCVGCWGRRVYWEQRFWNPASVVGELETGTWAINLETENADSWQVSW